MLIQGKTIVRVLVASACFISGAAATASAQGVGIGVKGGPVFAKFDSDDLNFKNRTGLQGGIFFGGNRRGAVGVMGEVNFIQKKAESEILPGVEVTVSYLQVPVFLRINGGSRSLSGVSFYAIVGPNLDIKLSEKIEGVTVEDGFEGLDIGLTVGAGVEITRFIIEGRYTWGLRRVNEDFSNVTEVKTKAFAILFGVRFN